MSVHNPLTNHFLTKVPNCTDRLYLQESSGVYISKGELRCSWGNYKQAFSPWRAANELRLCQQFSSGLLLKQRNTLQSDLPYYGNDRSLSTCLGEKREKNTCQVFILCNQGGITWKDQRRLEVGEQWSLQRAGRRRLGRGETLQFNFHCPQAVE